MYDEIAIIHQNPFGGVVAFDADRKLAGLLQLFFDFVTDGVAVAGVGTRADYKIISE